MTNKSRSFDSTKYKIRIKVEHVFSRLKVFKILGSVFRSNKDSIDDLSKYFIIVSAIYNLELSFN